MTETKHNAVPPQDISVIPTQSMSIMHPMVEKLLAHSPTPETLGQIFAIQREWEKDQAKKAYTRALVEMRKDLPTWIKRDQKVDFTSKTGGLVHYTHASLAAALDAVRPALDTHGFSLAWTPATDKERVSVTATLTHREGHSESATLSAPADASGSKSPQQAVASTVTLLQRYTALAILGIATSDMDEPTGNGASSEDGDAIDSAKNLRVLPEILKTGKTKEQAEEFVGKPIQKWTAGDLAKLKAWASPPVLEREPGEDEAPAPEPPPPVVEKLDVPIGKPEIAKITAWMKEYVLGKVAFSDLVESELGRRATGQDMTLREFGVIEEAFTKVRSGRWEIKDKKFSKPPDEEPKF